MKPTTALILSMLWFVPTARAQPGDGLYGRFDGDLLMSAAVGGGIVAGDGELVSALELRARYLHTAGLLLSPEWRPGPGEGRVIVAVELRPLFPARFFLNAESGHEWLDLLIDSLGFSLGAALTPLGDGMGAGLAFGAGFDVPLVLPSSFGRGVYLRLAARHVRTDASDQAGPEAGGSDWTFLGLLTIPVLLDLGIADREPPRYRVRRPSDRARMDAHRN